MLPTERQYLVTVPLWVWALTVLAILAMLAVDYVGHVRTPHAPSIKESAAWSAVYVGIALVFGAVVWAVWGARFGGEYFAGYVTEKSLSIDNLFVFVLIMSSFRVPRELQQKVLLVGITVALILRTVFIAAGAALISNFSWVFYLFGLFLVWTAISQLRHASDGEQDEFHEPAVLRLVRRAVPTSDTYVGDRLTTRVDGRRAITPMLIVMIAIGSADLLFAVDSIPAIFGLTEQTYLVFASQRVLAARPAPALLSGRRTARPPRLPRLRPRRHPGLHRHQAPRARAARERVAVPQRWQAHRGHPRDPHERLAGLHRSGAGDHHGRVPVSRPPRPGSFRRSPA